MVEEGKLEYRAGQQRVVRFDEVRSRPLLPGEAGRADQDNINIINLESNTNNINFYGYVEDQPPEWSELDYSLEVDIDKSARNILLIIIKAGKSSEDFV